MAPDRILPNSADTRQHQVERCGGTLGKRRDAAGLVSEYTNALRGPVEMTEQA
jgi:hypothetical protein